MVGRWQPVAWVVLVVLLVAPRPAIPENRLLTLRSVQTVGCETDGGPERNCGRTLGRTRERLARGLASALAVHPYECVGDRSRRSFEMVVGFEYNSGSFFADWGRKGQLVRQLPPCERAWIVHTVLDELKAVHEVDLRYYLRLRLVETPNRNQTQRPIPIPWQEREGSRPCAGRWVLSPLGVASNNGQYPPDRLPKRWVGRSVVLRHRLNGREDYVLSADDGQSNVQLMEAKESGDECRLTLLEFGFGPNAEAAPGSGSLIEARYDITARGAAIAAKASLFSQGAGWCEISAQATRTRLPNADLAFDPAKAESEFQGAWQAVKGSCKAPVVKTLPLRARVTARISPWGGLDELTVDGVPQQLWEVCDSPDRLWYHFYNPTGEFQEVTFDAALE